jgi:hypothetical protein
VPSRQIAVGGKYSTLARSLAHALSINAATPIVKAGALFDFASKR